MHNAMFLIKTDEAYKLLACSLGLYKPTKSYGAVSALQVSDHQHAPPNLEEAVERVSPLTATASSKDTPKGR